METKFYIGTAGWKYDDWIGSFYPKRESSTFDWLSYYSRYFNCVEVNSTYYAYMNERVYNSWLRKTEDLEDFVFTIKLHQDFTHNRSFTSQNITDMKNLLEALMKSAKLGGLLIQFPQSFKFDSTSIIHINKLNEIFSSYNIFLEVRHGSFHTKEALDFFSQSKINIITIDQPQIGNAIPFKAIVSSDNLYFRLHGRNKEDWFKGFDKIGQKQTDAERNARYNYLYSHVEFYEMNQQIKSVIEKIKKVFVITNNHPKGNAVANAFQLINMLENRKVEIPETSLKTYPVLKPISSTPPPVDLFSL